MRSADLYRLDHQRLLPSGLDRQGRRVHRHRVRRLRQPRPVTGADACGCAFHCRDRPALASGKADGEVKAEPEVTRMAVPEARAPLEATVVVVEIESEEVIVQFASAAVAWCAAALEVPSRYPVDRRALAEAAGIAR